MQDRSVVIHYHIYKNAGSSVDAMLQASFGDGWQAFEGLTRAPKTSEEIRRFLVGRPLLRALSTHTGRPPLPAPHYLPIVFLRHPILRARSAYRFALQDNTQPDHSAAAIGDFAAYVRWAVDGSEGGHVIRDYQVVHLSAASFREDSIRKARATEADLAEACALLNEWGIVGIVEQFDRSAALFQRTYGPKVPGLALSPVWANRTAESPVSIEDEIQSIRRTLGPTLYAALEARNDLDLRLYEFGCHLLEAAESGPSPTAIKSDVSL